MRDRREHQEGTVLPALQDRREQLGTPGIQVCNFEHPIINYSEEAYSCITAMTLNKHCINIPSGDVGDTGPDGEDGVDGAKGEKGDIGAIGDTGTTGDDGLQGDQGMQGPTGALGPKGEKGRPTGNENKPIKV